MSLKSRMCVIVYVFSSESNTLIILKTLRLAVDVITTSMYIYI